MNDQEYLKLLDEEEKRHCVGCGLAIGIDILHFPPDKYQYCHSYCCFCCPDSKEEICDKEAVNMNLLAIQRG